MASQKPVNKIKTIKADSKFTDDDYYKYNYNMIQPFINNKVYLSFNNNFITDKINY